VRKLNYLVILYFFFIPSVNAYIGPGLGMGVIGSIFGILFAFFLGIVGVIWYPIKRFFKRRKNNNKNIIDESGDGADKDKDKEQE